MLSDASHLYIALLEHNCYVLDSATELWLLNRKKKNMARRRVKATVPGVYACSTDNRSTHGEASSTGNVQHLLRDLGFGIMLY